MEHLTRLGKKTKERSTPEATCESYIMKISQIKENQDDKVCTI